MTPALLAFGGRAWAAVVYFGGEEGPRVVSLHATRRNAELDCAERNRQLPSAFAVRRADTAPSGGFIIDLDAE